MKHYKIKLTDKFSGVRLVTVTAKNGRRGYGPC